MEKPDKPLKTSSWLPLSLAGCLGGIGGLVLLFLTLGFALEAALIGAALFATVGFHYLVWGRWLGGSIRAEVEAEERQQVADLSRRRAK